MKTNGYAVLLDEVAAGDTTNLTLADAANIVKISRNYPKTLEDITFKEMIDIVHHVYGEPRDLLNKFGMFAIRGRITCFLDCVASLGITLEKAESEAADAATDGQPLDRIKVGGHAFFAPNLDTEVMELWIAMETALDTIKAQDLTDIEALPIILGTLCREVDTSYSDHAIPARIELMRDARYVDGIRIASFFFGSSSVFAQHVSRAFPSSPIWNGLRNGLALIRTGSVGADLQRSISLLISSQGSTPGSAPSPPPSVT